MNELDFDGLDGALPPAEDPPTLVDPPSFTLNDADTLIRTRRSDETPLPPPVPPPNFLFPAERMRAPSFATGASPSGDHLQVLPLPAPRARWPFVALAIGSVAVAAGAFFAGRALRTTQLLPLVTRLAPAAAPTVTQLAPAAPTVTQLKPVVTQLSPKDELPAPASLDDARVEHQLDAPAFFPFNDPQPHDLDAEELTARARALLDACNGRLVITGHTDWIGGETLNHEVGLSRARAVERALVAAGIDEAVLEVTSAGSTQPIGNNRTPDGRRANRRVTLSCPQRDGR